MTIALRAVAVVLTGLLAACSSGGVGGASATDVLLSRLPSPLPQALATEQQLNSADVSSATPADPAALARFLGGSSFAEAFERVWTQTSADYVTLLALRFDQAPDAARMVQFEVKQLTDSTNTYVSAHAAIPGSSVFVINGPTRIGGATETCEGVWMAISRFAVETLTCSAQGAWATAAEDLASRERDLIQQTGG